MWAGLLALCALCAFGTALAPIRPLLLAVPPGRKQLALFSLFVPMLIRAWETALVRNLRDQICACCCARSALLVTIKRGPVALTMDVPYLLALLGFLPLKWTTLATLIVCIVAIFVIND